MLKSLALGLLTLGAACTTTALAHDHAAWQDFTQWCESHQRCDQREDQHEGDKNDQPIAAPEIDPSGAMGALTLLAGGLAVIRGRRRSGAE